MKLSELGRFSSPTSFLLVAACAGAPLEKQSDQAGYVSGEELPGGATTNTLLFGQNALSRPAENATESQELSFYSGNAFFSQAWVEAPSSTEARDGLGPLFNARSCAACHFRDGRGHPPFTEGDPLEGLLFRASRGQDDLGMPLADSVYGGQIQPFSLAGVPSEATVSIKYEEREGRYPDGTRYQLLAPRYELVETAYGPTSGLQLSPRVAPAMHGLGLLEAISDSRLTELSDEDDLDGDGISGRVRLVPDVTTSELRIGRFGWKNEQPTIRQQSAGALNGDMGLSTSLFPRENCTAAQPECANATSGGTPEVSDEILEKLTIYSRLIAVPARQDAKHKSILDGKRLFFESQCPSCHTPQHTTSGHELAELNDQTIYPYTDLLLHDMGVELADEDGSTEIQREWRTPPLWALRFYEVVNGHDRLLHDGRARGVEEAILWHGGEAERARERFMALESEDRDLLIRFVESL